MLEVGKRQPTLNCLKQIAAYFRIPIDALSTSPINENQNDMDEEVKKDDACIKRNTDTTVTSVTGESSIRVMVENSIANNILSLPILFGIVRGVIEENRLSLLALEQAPENDFNGVVSIPDHKERIEFSIEATTSYIELTFLDFTCVSPLIRLCERICGFPDLLVHHYDESQSILLWFTGYSSLYSKLVYYFNQKTIGNHITVYSEELTQIIRSSKAAKGGDLE